MTVNEMKNYLSEYRRLKHRAERLEVEIECFPQDKVFLEPLYKSVKKKVEDISSKIRSVKKSEYREILIRKYINGETLEEIGDSFCYSARHVQRLLKRAVSTIEGVDGQ